MYQPNITLVDFVCGIILLCSSVMVSCWLALVNRLQAAAAALTASSVQGDGGNCRAMHAQQNKLQLSGEP